MSIPPWNTYSNKSEIVQQQITWPTDKMHQFEFMRVHQPSGLAPLRCVIKVSVHQKNISKKSNLHIHVMGKCSISNWIINEMI